MPMNPDRLPKVKEDPDRHDGPESLIDSIMNEAKERLLNAKWKGEITPRIYLSQANSKDIRIGKGRYGPGAYAIGKMIDGNTEDIPDTPLSVAPGMLMDERTLAEQYGTTSFNEAMSKVKDDGYLGYAYDDDKYFLFGDLIPEMARSLNSKSNKGAGWRQG